MSENLQDQPESTVGRKPIEEPDEERERREKSAREGGAAERQTAPPGSGDAPAESTEPTRR